MGVYSAVPMVLSVIVVLFVISACESTETAFTKSELRNIIDSGHTWKAYVNLFDKNYSSLTQQLLRQKMFMARTLEVLQSAIKYKAKQLNYYLALNEFSDLTPAESDRLTNGDNTEPSPEELLDDDVAGKILLNDLKSHDKPKSEYSDSADGRERMRQKRSLNIDSDQDMFMDAEDEDLEIPDLEEEFFDAVSDREPMNVDSSRDLTLDDLIHFGKKDTPSDHNQWASIFSLNWFGKPLTRNIDPVRPSNSPSQSNSTPIFAFLSVKNTLARALGWTQTTKPIDSTLSPDKLINEDTIVVEDWRRSNCIGPVRNQGFCSSCYAISSMNFFEWALCKNNGELLPLSPQYIVSCGKQFSDESKGRFVLKGCDRGVSWQTIDFVKEYGLELESNLPYRANETECPVELNSHRRNKGYTRINVKKSLRLSGNTKQLDLALKLGPVIASMRQPKNFVNYGGGILDKCETEGGHAMLVVGNMIEKGEEFLLIKNSFGPNWGYEGYLKFKRSSAPECVKEFIVPRVSFPGRKAQIRRMKSYLSRRMTPLDHDHDEDSYLDHLTSFLNHPESNNPSLLIDDNDDSDDEDADDNNNYYDY